MFHPAVYTRVFGSFTAALEQAQVLSRFREGVLDEEVVEELRALSTDLERVVTPDDITEGFIVTVEEILLRFGKWYNALFKADVDAVTENELTEDEEFLLYRHEVGDYTIGFGEFGYLSGWGEHHTVLEFLDAQGEQQFTTEEFATVIEGSSERAGEMLAFVESLGFVRHNDEGWVVRIEDQENVAGWLRRGNTPE